MFSIKPMIQFNIHLSSPLPKGDITLVFRGLLKIPVVLDYYTTTRYLDLVCNFVLFLWPMRIPKLRSHLTSQNHIDRKFV